MNLALPRSTWGIAALALAAGGTSALGQAPWSLWPLSIFGFAVLFWMFGAATAPRRAAWLGWSFGTGYFAVALFWIVEPFLVDIARHGWMAPFALLFMATGFALFWAGALGLASGLARPRFRVPAVVFALTLAELLRGVILTGFPWATIGHVWVGHAPAQLAAYGGAGLLTVLLLCVAALPFAVSRKTLGGFAAAVLLLGAWGLGTLRLEHADDLSGTPLVRVIQPNAPQHLKWDPAHAQNFLRRQLAMTEAAADAPLAAIIWPETSVTTRLDQAGVITGAMAEAAAGVPVVFGANDLVDGSYRNALALLDARGAVAQRYHKHHLVPFGEYIPLGELAARFGIRGLAARDGGGFAPGPGPALIEIEGLGTALPLICYELIFPRHLRHTERPDVILQITNDAWFGNVSGPYQHLAQARLRAIEQGLGVIRSANTGISAVIDPYGQIMAEAPLNKTGFFDEPVPSALPATIYSQIGDWPLTAAFVLLFIGIARAPGPIGD
ncbi:MAG: apolipoprotein N-acyltransferase [Pseudomonadota bacterium]